MRIALVSTSFAAACLLAPPLAHAQVDCWAPREQQDSVATARFTPIRQTLLAIEEIVRRNAAYLAPPEPVRMRTTIAAGPSEAGGARIFVRAYPEKQTTADIQIWTKDRCDVIPQAERVAASVGQIYVFVNYNVQEQFLGGDAVPKYEGEIAGYPIYNNRVVVTKDRRLPWIPQTLADRLDREERSRQRAIDEWNAIKASRKIPDEAAQTKAYEAIRKTDPAGAETLLASMRETAERVRQLKAEEPLTDAHLQRHLQAVRTYRASFTAAELGAPAVWMDRSGDARRRLDARIAELQKLSPEAQRQIDAIPRDAPDRAQRFRAIRQAHTDKASFPIQDARAEYDLVHLKPGPAAQALAFKPDPAFPDYTDPFRPQLLMVVFWSKSDPKDNSPRTVWLRKARETFDFAALAALLR